ncbi:MAG: sialate O-acetylesterase [Prevotella sp.]|nr:sialate O-acetylesterase [Prevotella sp.]
MKRLVLFTFLMLSLSMAAKDKLRVACVGNSVTYGYGLSDREHDAYPVVLQQLLGEGFDVRNFGHSGATLLRHGHRPYTQLPEFRDALDFKADLVVIHLGLNDTDPRNWPNYGDEFIGDYRALIDSFRVANPQAKIWICLMTPIFNRHHRFQSGTRDWHEAIQKTIRKIAQTPDVGLIDLHTPLYCHPDFFPDALHPNAEGAKIMARTIYSALTGDFGGLRPSPMYLNGMVLQRGDSIQLHGTANTGDEVCVTFNGATLSTQTNRDGEWQVKFPSIKAGGPYKLTFESFRPLLNQKKKNKKRKADQQITLDSVYVGEVWLCSGQSNMEFTLGATTDASPETFNAHTASLLHLLDLSTNYPTDNVEWSREACDSVNHLRLLKRPRWQLANTENIKRFSAIAYHMGRMLADSLKVPIGIICNAVGGTTTESWIDRKTLEWEMPNILTDWYFGDYGQPWARGRALKNIAKVVNKEKDGQQQPDLYLTRQQRHPYEPCYMFEAGILPLDHYQIKGVAWYQGESNAHNIELHEQLFNLLRRSWRAYFGRSIAFNFVQLSGLNRPSWPAFRESQRRLGTGHYGSGMVVSHDCGDSLDVHYRTKRPVGERLALLALRNTYEHKLTYSGPNRPKALISREGVMISFWDNNKGLHPSSGDRIIGFELAGEDGIFYPAEARVVEDCYIVVNSPQVEKPAEVRYAWQPFTRANVVNDKGLPLSTFKIDVKPANYVEIFD